MKESSLAQIEPLVEQLLAWFEPSSEYVLAFSGGVDSAVVAAAAQHSGSSLIAVTARSPSVSQRDRDDAHQIAQQLGLDHRWMDTTEFLTPDYRRNDSRRCFHCKSHLFSALQREFPGCTILSGTNLDDHGDYRPGLEAARNASVRSPLSELSIGKQQVRSLARYWKIPVAEKPASPCLASRLAYGVEATPQRLARVEAAELFLRELLGIDDCRVRVHPDELARIEVSQSAFSRLAQPDARQRLLEEFQRLGFNYVTVDLASQRSGSLNAVLSINLPRSID